MDLRPGILLSPDTLLYGRVGAAFNTLKITSDSINMGSYVFPVFFNRSLQLNTASALVASDSKDVTGLRLGAGLEQYLGYNIAIEADYIYTNYGDINVNSIGNSIGGEIILGEGDDLIPHTIPGGFVNHTKVDVTSNAALVGLTYYFGPHSTAA